MSPSPTRGSETPFLAMDNYAASVCDDALSIQKTCDGTLLRLAVADLAIVMSPEVLRQPVSCFIRNPWKRDKRSDRLAQRIAFPRDIQKKFGLKHGREQAVSIVGAVLTNEGMIENVEHKTDNITVEMVKFSDRKLQNAPRDIERIFEEMRDLVQKLVATNKHGLTAPLPPSPSKTIEFLLRIMSKAAAKLAKEEGIPVLHKNYQRRNEVSFSRTFVHNDNVGDCPDGFVQCNAPLRRTTDLVNAVNIVTAKNGAFFRAELLEKMEAALARQPAWEDSAAEKGWNDED